MGAPAGGGIGSAAPGYDDWLREQKAKKSELDEQLLKGLEAARAIRKEKLAKAQPNESRTQATFKDFRHGVIHFEGVGMSAKYLLPPANLEDPSLIVKAMFEKNFWNMDPPSVVFSCDELLFAGPGPGGGYFLQDDGAQARPVQWEHNWPEWSNVVMGQGRSAESAANEVPRQHMMRMMTMARACHQTASEHDLSPWFFSGAPCPGGGDGGKMFADYVERANSPGAGARPVFVGAPSPSQGLFEEEATTASLQDGGAPPPLDSTAGDTVKPTGSRKQPGDVLGGLLGGSSSQNLLPFILRANTDIDLQAFAVKLSEPPQKRVSYPDDRRNLLGDKDSNRRFMNPGVTHYVFFRSQQDKLHRAFTQMVQASLAASVRIVVGPCLNPAYAKSIYDDARRRRGSLTLILDKSAPLATRMAAGIRVRRSRDEGPASDGVRALQDFEQRVEQSFRQTVSGAFGGNQGAPYDLSPIEVPRELDSTTLASLEIVPFLDEATEQGFFNKVSDMLGRKLPHLASTQNRSNHMTGAMMHEGHLDRISFYWELASRLFKTADRRHFRRKILQYIAVTTLFIAFQYAIFFGYDEPEVEHDTSYERPCEARVSPVHWIGRLWEKVCPYANIIRFFHAFFPAIAVAVLMKLNMPLTLLSDEHGRWLRSASADLLREVYRYRTCVGAYRPVAHKWSKSAAFPPGHGELAGPRPPNVIFEERAEVIEMRVLQNTNHDVENLDKPSAREIENFKKMRLTTPENPSPNTEKQPSGASSYTRVGDTDSTLSGLSTRSTIATCDDGRSHLTAEEYVHFRLIGSRERFRDKRQKQKCLYELWWVVIIFMTIAAAVFSILRMNLSMLMCMVGLTAVLVVVDMDHMPLRLKQTGTAIQVLGEYLAAWERLSPRERKTHAKLHALVDGVEDIILKEDPFYMSNQMSIHTNALSPKATEPANIGQFGPCGRSLHFSPRRPDLERIDIVGGSSPPAQFSNSLQGYEQSPFGMGGNSAAPFGMGSNFGTSYGMSRPFGAQ